MPLGPNKWNAAKPFYGGLTLATDGDPNEREGARASRITGCPLGTVR